MHKVVVKILVCRIVLDIIDIQNVSSASKCTVLSHPWSVSRRYWALHVLIFLDCENTGQTKVSTLTSSVSASIYLSNRWVNPRICALIVFSFPIDRISSWKQSIKRVNLSLYSHTINSKTICNGIVFSVD